MRRATVAMAGLLAAGALAAACAGGKVDDALRERADTAAATATSVGGLIASLNPDVRYPESFDSETGLGLILGTPDLGVGTQRIAFVLTHERGLVRFPVVSVSSYYRPGGLHGPEEGPVQSGRALFSAFPLGTRGTYVSELDFDRPGAWELEVSFPNPDGGRMSARLAFEVRERASAPAVGDRAPESVNRTLADVAGVDQLTTGPEPNPELYRTTIAGAIANHRPFVVVFASPAFCTNAFCGPQVEVVSALRERYGDRADFIHVDIYANPQEIQGDLRRGVRNLVLAEWGITGDEWTFLVGGDGRIAARFESFVSEEELERAVLAALGETAVGGTVGSDSRKAAAP